MAFLSVRAAVITAPRTVEVADFELRPPVADEVEVEVLACGICGSNLHAWRHPELAIEAGGSARPGATGHEIAVRTPAGRVAVVEPNLAAACGECAACGAGTPWFCRARREVPAWGFAERLVVRRDALYESGAEPAVATLAEPLACAVHALRLCARDLRGARVAVLGAGVAGLMAAAVARGAGAGEVVVSARHAHQAALARDFGATAVVAPDERLAHFDVVVEAVGGSAPTFEQALRAAAPRAEVIVLGLFDEPQRLDARRAVFRELRLLFPVTYSREGGADDFGRAVAMVGAREYPFERLVTHRFPLERVAEAFATAADKMGGSVRVVVEPSP